MGPLLVVTLAGADRQLSRKWHFPTEVAAPVSSYMVARAPQRFALKPQSRSTSTPGWRPQNDESGLVDTSNVVWVGYGNFELFNPAARRVRIKRHFTRFKAILTHLHGSLRM